MTLSYADIFDLIADELPENAIAIICNGEALLWKELKHRSDALAQSLLNHGLQTGEKVALYMRNGPDYLIAFIACLKARLVSANINFRYGSDEVEYLLQNSDAEAVIFDAEFYQVLSKTKSYPSLKARISSRGEARAAVPISVAYEAVPCDLPRDRSGDDIFLLYTGGTTGLPKGVMWPCASVWESLSGMRIDPDSGQPINQPEKLRDLLRAGGIGLSFYIAPPFMHGTGLMLSIGVLTLGGTVVCSGAKSFDPHKLLTCVQNTPCSGIVIVGDAFGAPLLDALSGGEQRYDLDHVKYVLSSGMMWSPHVKAGLLEYMPNAILSDSLGASEASAIAASVTTKDSVTATGVFSPVETQVVDPDTLLPIEPGSGQIGVIAKGGALPLGYYKDPERTARTYVLIDGVRHMISGDHAKVSDDGEIILLGRGSNCINTAGEKVYPEEVEESLKTHPQVKDALVFSLPHKRFGQTVTALVASDRSLEAEELISWVKSKLAHYKAPKKILIVSDVPRGPNGKADYEAAREQFQTHAAADA